MRIAILSDIHGNSFALNAILKSKEFQSVDLRLNAGDLVGYYFSPKEVIDSLSLFNFKSVRGNHEDMLTNVLSDNSLSQEIENHYGKGLRQCCHELSSSELESLLSLPDFLRIETGSGNLYLFHGTPKGNDLYFYPDSPESEIKAAIPADCRWLILGNTHWPMIRYVGNTVVINPGSVGQPRNATDGANWAILDTDCQSVTFLTTTYPEFKLISSLDFLAVDASTKWQAFGN